MMKRVLSIILAVLLFCTSVTMIAGAEQSAETTQAQAEFVPVLRFVASSDTHVRDDDDTNAKRIGRMMDLAYSFAEKDKNYSKLDALLICGDMTHGGTPAQFEKLKTAVNGALRGDTLFLGIGAKNHDGYDMSRVEMRAAVSEITGRDADFHIVIGGYHFIGISASPNGWKHYDKDQLAWLKEQLTQATAEDPNKPVFVMQHEHVTGTVYGSSEFERWGTSYFREIFEQFPQVVDFSGHSHYPLNYPTSIWQGAFTAVGTGAVKSTDYTVEDMRDIAGEGHELVSNFWLVEADAANRIRLRGIDLLAGKVLCEYVLDNPAIETNRAFSPENRKAASKAPVFEPGAVMSVTGSDGTCTVKVSGATSTDGMPVVLYRAYAKDSSGKVIQKTWTQPKYYLADTINMVELTLKGLGKGEYTIEVVAETAFGVQSEPLQGTVTINEPSQCWAFFDRLGRTVYHWFDVAWNAVV